MIKESLSTFPKLSLEVKVEVIGEQDILHTDIISVIMTITNHNHSDLKYAHCPLYPEARESKFHVMIGNTKNDIIYYQLATMNKKTLEIAAKFQTQTVGQNIIYVCIQSDTYMGVGIEKQLEFVALDGLKHQRATFIHQEDKDLEKQPTLFSQMMKDLQEE